MHCEKTALHHDPDFDFYCDSDCELDFDVGHGPYPSLALCRGNYHRDVLIAHNDHGSGFGCDCGCDSAFRSDHRPCLNGEGSGLQIC